ncbi:DNA-binding MarR family transcriptional regulator [Pseudacidovorax sp. 1753]|uniref:MarR family winged helix-turn-helix transcriptional regulator n=1 Tax=Pseudacidovorax sp. 1753 TaxID=3156419 RepID=UPI0033987C58
MEDCAYAKLRRLTRCVAQHFDSELAKAGLKATQLWLLSEVRRLQPVEPGELARSLGIDPSTLTRALRPLLSAGWIELGAGKDARSRSIRLTDSGRAKQAIAGRRLRIARRTLDEKLGPLRVAELKALMDESLQIFAAV